MVVALNKRIMYSGKEIIKSSTVNEIIDGRPVERTLPGTVYVSKVFFFCPEKCRERGCRPDKVYSKWFVPETGIRCYEVGHRKSGPITEVNDEIRRYTSAAYRVAESGKSEEVECPGRKRKFRIKDFTHIGKFDFQGLFNEEPEIYTSELI